MHLDARPGLEADLSALLLCGGRVRGDDDFVFFDQPTSADRRVFHAGKTATADGSVTDRIVVDLVGFDDAVSAIAIAVSLDDATALLLVLLGYHDAARESLKDALRVRSRAAGVRHRALLERAQVNLAQHRRAAARRDLERILAEDRAYPGLLEAPAALG